MKINIFFKKYGINLRCETWEARQDHTSLITQSTLHVGSRGQQVMILGPDF